MAERHPWKSSTVGMVAGLAGIIGGGIGYGLAPTAPQPAVAAAAPAEPETEAADATPAARPDRADRAERKRTRKRPQAVASGPVDLSEVRGEEWVTIHDPQQTWPGYTLVFYQRRLPMLIDMSGRIVHYWPEVRGVGRARLTAEGNLVYIASDDAVREVDWNGKLVREYKSDVEGRFPHHDLQWVPDGRIASIYRTKSEFTDDVVLLGKSGEELWTWKSRGHLDADFPTSREESKDLTHFNSVQVIPENPHQRAGDQRFKAGNILISARHLNHIYMVDPDTGEVVWKYGDGLDWQHEATMLGDDSPSPGNILLFNNRYHSEDRRSEVIEINPTTNEVVWRYSVEGFFSDTAGVAQKLPNGNVLITSSRGGRLFEVTASGEVVWQWQPPYLPMRVNRYAPDYCPQLAAMGPPSGGPVTSKETGGPFIDSALYDFKLAEGVRRVMVGVKKRDVLTSGKVCHDVQLPGKPSIVLDIGFVMPAGDTPPAMDGTVKVTVAPEGGAAEVVLEKDVSPAEDGGWLRERARIPKPMAYQKVEICVESSSPDITSREDLRPGLVVGAPKIISGFRSSAKNLPSVRDKGTQRAERDLQQRQLEALGYIE